MKRLALIIAAVFVVLFLTGSLLLWAFLSAWVPVKGKALLIQTLEEHQPITVSIGVMRYELFQGFVLEEVRVTQRATQTLWCALPAMRVRVDWLPLLARRLLVFHSRASVDAPCPTRVSLSGRYDLRTQSFALDARTEAIALRALTDPLARHIPSALTDGTVRLLVHLRHPPQGHLAIAGEVIGDGLVWAARTWRLIGDVTAEGSAIPPVLAGDRWSFQAELTLRDGTLTGVPVVGTMSRLRGNALLVPEQLDVETLTGVAFGSPWTLEGTVAMGARPSFEAVVSAQANLAPIAEAFLPSARETWHVDGPADLRAVCRGPLHPAPFLDCAMQTALRGVTLTGAKLTHPVTEIAGGLRYDFLTHQLELHTLTGRLASEPFTVSGTLNTAHPKDLTLTVRGTLPLDMATRWVPPHSPVSDLNGLVTLDLQLRGAPTGLESTGQLDIQDGLIQWIRPPLRLEHLIGSIQLRRDQLEIQQATVQVNQQPMTVAATITPPPPVWGPSAYTPRVTATVELPQGQCWVAARVTPDVIDVEESQLLLAHSRLHGSGAISRQADRPTTLNLSGSLELSDVSHLPFISLPTLEAWRLKGLAEVEAKFEGSLHDWQAATIQGLLTADHLSAREVPLDQLMCIIEQRRRLLRLRVPSARVADGKLWGELAIEHGPKTQDYLVQADVVGLQLAQLAHTIPAWQARSVTGNASAHATLSGTWEQRASWQGAGWLNASGERLGDLPLLDQLFRGLFGVLADRLGLDTLRRAQLTQASLQWQLAQERFRTEDLRLRGLSGTEPVAVYANGSVGFDRSLDFVIEPELSERIVLQSPTTSTLAATVLKAAGQLDRLRRLIGRHRLTGTLDHPTYRFELSTQEIFKQLAPAAGDFLQQLLESVR